MSLERIQVDVPDQPPIGSVVLDRTGTAWQRRTENDPAPWTSTGSGTWLSWPELLITLGPLDVLHRAGRFAGEVLARQATGAK